MEAQVVGNIFIYSVGDNGTYSKLLTIPSSTFNGAPVAHVSISDVGKILVTNHSYGSHNLAAAWVLDVDMDNSQSWNIFDIIPPPLKMNIFALGNDESNKLELSMSDSTKLTLANSEVSSVSYTIDVNGTWSQIGGDIDGSAANDYTGYNSCMNSDGTIFAVSAYGADVNGADSGRVRVYQYNGSSWIQMGQDINGDSAGDLLMKVALSSDGTILATGAQGDDNGGTDAGQVRVYQYNGSSWVQIGQDINGTAPYDYTSAVSLNSDGTILGVGETGNDAGGSNAGRIRVFEYDGSSWVQKGQSILGEAAEDQMGGVNLNPDGSILATAALLNQGNGTRSGHIRVYQYDGSSWIQMGQDIDGEQAEDRAGYSVTLSTDGTVVCIGAAHSSTAATKAGAVYVYQYDGSSWSKKGQTIYGEGTYNYAGNSAHMTPDGSIIAVGAYRNSENGTNSGQVRVFQYDGTTSLWVQVGQSILGEAAGDETGNSVSLSSDGSILAIGARYNDGAASNAGHVRVFSIPKIQTIINSGASYDVSYNGVLSEFTHIVGTINNNSMKLYVNNVLVDSTTVVSFADNTTFTHNYLGSDLSNSSLFEGSIAIFQDMERL